MPPTPQESCLIKKGTNGSTNEYLNCWGDAHFKTGKIDCCKFNTAAPTCCHKIPPVEKMGKKDIRIVNQSWRLINKYWVVTLSRNTHWYICQSVAESIKLQIQDMSKQQRCYLNPQYHKSFKWIDIVNEILLVLNVNEFFKWKTPFKLFFIGRS